MGPFERFIAAARFEPVDYVPVAGAVTDFYMNTITPGLDGLSGPDQLIRMMEYGAEIFPEMSLIFMMNPTPAIYPELIRRLRESACGGPIRIEHIRETKIPDPEKDALNLARLAEIQYFIEKLPAGLKTRYGYCDGLIRFENPFDTLCEVVGSSEWFARTATDKEFVEAAMELFTEASVAGARWLAEKIGQPTWTMLAEDFPGFIKRESFERFVVPYHKQIFDTFPNALKLLHNDSNVSHLLDALPASGMDIFHFGYEVDVAAAKKAMGGRVALMGNLAPMTVLARDPLETVRESCRHILEAGKTGGGFVLATGGEVNPGTSPERVNLMVECAKEYGKY
ncbi:MAG: uroporphyrinogen decarboxylase family protein [bacterium]